MPFDRGSCAYGASPEVRAYLPGQCPNNAPKVRIMETTKKEIITETKYALTKAAWK